MSFLFSQNDKEVLKDHFEMDVLIDIINHQCGDQEKSLALKWAPSIDPVAENAQQDPHCCWFLIGVT